MSVASSVDTDEKDRLALRVAEVARRLDCGVSTIYELIAAGHLPVIYVGRGKRRPRMRVTVAGLADFMAAGGVPQETMAERQAKHRAALPEAGWARGLI